MKKALAIAVACTLVVLGGAYAATQFFEAAEDDAIKYAPRDSFLYANVFLDPSNGQKMAVRDLLERFPEAGTPDEAKDAIARLIDGVLQETGLTFDDDVDPWLGKQIALFLTAPTAPSEEPDGALLVATEDAAATRTAVEEAFARSAPDADERSYEGAEYHFQAEDDSAVGVVGDFLVAGTQSGFEDVVDVSRGAPPLAGSERWSRATSKLTEDRLAVFYLDLKPVFDVFEDTGGIPPAVSRSGLLEPFQQPVAAVLFARRNGVVFEASAQRGDEGAVAPRPPALLPELPGDSWLALGASDLGRRFDTALRGLVSSGVPGLTPEIVEGRFRSETGLDLRRDLLSWIGDIGLFVRGTNPQDLGGGAVIESLDPGTSTRAIERLGVVARRFGAPVRPLPIAGDGFALEEPGMAEPVLVVARGDRVAVTYGRASTLRAFGSDRSLGGTPEYEDALDALGGDFSPGGLLNVPSILALADSLGAASDPVYQEQVKPFLDPLAFVIFGSKLDDDTFVTRVVIGVR